MYYPKQIPYLLDKEFQKNIEYKEYQINELRDYCMCIWTMESKNILDKTSYNYILPDACIDIVIDFSNKSICCAGFSKDTIPFELNKKIDFMGVRLKPSSFYLLFGINSDKIMDNPVPLNEIDIQNNLEKILDCTLLSERLKLFKDYLVNKINKINPINSIEIVENLYKNPSKQNVMAISKSFGCNERHLYRIFKTYYGVSPKVLLNILRLHLCLTMLLEKEMNLIDIANMCGFYDQAHFIKEIKKYTGFSPLQLIDRYK